MRAGALTVTGTDVPGCSGFCCAVGGGVFAGACAGLPGACFGVADALFGRALERFNLGQVMQKTPAVRQERVNRLASGA